MGTFVEGSEDEKQIQGKRDRGEWLRSMGKDSVSNNGITTIEPQTLRSHSLLSYVRVIPGVICRGCRIEGFVYNSRYILCRAWGNNALSIFKALLLYHTQNRETIQREA